MTSIVQQLIFQDCSTIFKELCVNTKIRIISELFQNISYINVPT
jgi:hypothetical protein